jgi:hypothetical protein
MFSKSKKQPEPSRRRARLSQQPDVRSNAVFSYHANRSVRETNQFRDAEREQSKDTPRRQHRANWAKKMPAIAIGLAVVVLLGFCLQLSDNAKVETVGTASGQLFLRDKSVYAAAARQAFAVWTNGNKMTVDTAKISADLRKQFPELQVVSVSLPVIGTQPTVYIQPAIPKLLLVSKNGMFVLDSNGRALIAGNQVAKLTELGVPVVTDESGLTIDAGNIALPKATVSFITEVVGQLKAKGLTVNSMTMPAGTNELHIKIDKVGYEVICNLHGNAREEAGSYLAVKQWLEANKKSPRAYVDVRVENKAYYQ